MDEDDFFKRIKPAVQYQGEVYYHIKFNRFFQVRKMHDDFLLCGGFCSYYNDAKTIIGENVFSWDVLKDSLKVKSLDEYPEFWEYSGVGWRVKE